MSASACSKKLAFVGPIKKNFKGERWEKFYCCYAHGTSAFSTYKHL